MADAAAAGAADEAAVAEPAASAANAISEEEVSALLESNAAGKVRPYDMTSQRINQTRLPMLENVCRGLAEKMGPALAALVGRDAAVQFTASIRPRRANCRPRLPVPRASPSFG